MKTTNIKLDNMEKINPFKTPAGYFEGVCDSIMSQLPEREIREPQVVGLWERVRPWVYMAAMFVGIMLMVNIFVDRHKTSGILSEDVDNISISEIDDFNSYYQERVAYSSYKQALYTEEDIEVLNN